MSLTRSEQMARIRSKHTKPERVLRSALWAAGLRYRLHVSELPGRPDIVFKGSRVVVWVDGCFWHGCPEHYVYPRTRREYWSRKLARNVERDRQQTYALENAGWRVVRVWEHDIRGNLENTVERIQGAVRREGEDRDRKQWRVEAVEVIDPDADTELRFLCTLRMPIRRKTVEGLSIRRSR